MGGPKLLLPVQGRTLIDGLLDALTPAMDQVFVLVREGHHELLAVLRERRDVTIVETASDPPDMRASVELLLARIAESAQPHPDDAWVLSPADHPVIRQGVLDVLKEGFAKRPGAIHIPTYLSERGHPTFFPWALASKVGSLPVGQGINALRSLEDVSSVFHPVDEPSVLWDVDTPADYEQVLRAIVGQSE